MQLSTTPLSPLVSIWTPTPPFLLMTVLYTENELAFGEARSMPSPVLWALQEFVTERMVLPVPVEMPITPCWPTFWMWVCSIDTLIVFELFVVSTPRPL